MRDFFVTLPSNASMESYPENKTSEFTVKLPSKLTFAGKTKVGLSELHIPYNIINVTKQNNTITFFDGENNIVTQILVDEGPYNSVEQIIGNINKKIRKCSLFTLPSDREVFSYNLKRNFVHVHDIIGLITKKNRITDEKENKYEMLGQILEVPNENSIPKVKKITLQNRLSLQLGFPCDRDIMLYTVSPFPCGAQFGIPDQILVYCDIIDYQIVGHTYAKIIKTVTIERDKISTTSNICKAFSPVQYVELGERSFDKISINIRDTQGELISFLYGTSIVQLHFIEE